MISMKKTIIFLYISIYLCIPINVLGNKRPIIGITIAGLFAAGIYGLTKKIRTPKKFNPTQKNLRIQVFEPPRLITHNDKIINAVTFDLLVETLHKGKTPENIELLISSKNKEKASVNSRNYQ